jgi:hypothetical protein
VKGRHKYVPVNVLQELENVKASDGIHGDSEAFKRIVDYCRIGREVKKRKIL